MEHIDWYSKRKKINKDKFDLLIRWSQLPYSIAIV